jgi:hypothetical protein
MIEIEATSLAAQVAELEKIAKSERNCSCGEVRATLLVNYGEEGRAIAGLVYSQMGTLQMLVEVLRYYHEKGEE